MTVNFEGVKINSELLPTLQAIWAEHGSLIGKDPKQANTSLCFGVIGTTHDHSSKHYGKEFNRFRS